MARLGSYGMMATVLPAPAAGSMWETVTLLRTSAHDAATRDASNTTNNLIMVSPLSREWTGGSLSCGGWRRTLRRKKERKGDTRGTKEAPRAQKRADA